jgi:peptide/nickel transport system permease protein
MDMWRRFWRNTAGATGLILVVSSLLVALFAPLLQPHDPTHIYRGKNLKPPSSEHLLGTDELGRDLLSRIIHGARVSVKVGIVAVVIGATGGVVLGLLSGYFGGLVDSMIMRVMDVLFAFPSILLALAIVALLGPDLVNVMIVIGIVYMPRFARVVRASVLTIKELDYVVAAQASGASTTRILFLHVLPNCTAPLIVEVSLGFSRAVLTEATLSFLGLGIQPPEPSLGSMLNASRRFMEIAPWTAVFPALAIMLLILGLNLMGDGLRDTLDPRLKS